MPTIRKPLSVTLSVWRAIFLREALDRLFDMRAAWFWLFFEPVIHIGFISFIWRAMRVRSVGGGDIVVWTLVGMLAFFFFRRTGVQVMHAVDSNRPLFTYRQVKPFDTAIARAGLEAFLMLLISTIILLISALLEHQAFPEDFLFVALIILGIWLFGLGYGLVTSVSMALVPETEHLFKIIMMPMYILSGVIMPITSIPHPFRDWMMINPLAHAIELVRLGFIPNYHAEESASVAYLFGWVAASLFLGLVLYRRFAIELVRQ